MRGDSKRGASAWRLLPTLLAALLPGANGQESRPATENLTALCRLWGLVKYHHPALATGDIDWDAALVEALPAVEQARGEEELGLALGRLLAALGDGATRILRNERADVEGPAPGDRRREIEWSRPRQPEGRHMQGGVALLTATDYEQITADTFGEGSAGFARAMLACRGAEALVLDLRLLPDRGDERADEIDQWSYAWAFRSALALLLDRDLALSSKRVRMQAGLPPDRELHRDLFFAGLFLEEHPVVPALGSVLAEGAPLVFVVNLGSRDSVDALAGLQAGGRAVVLFHGDHPERMAYTYTLPLAGRLLARVRVADTLNPDGSAGFIPDLVIPSGADPLPIALAIARGESRRPKARREVLPLHVPVQLLEDAAPAEALPRREWRLLALFRFWNAIEFFYPYKELLDRPWGETLERFLPRFAGAESALDYHLAAAELAASLQDTHGWIQSTVLDEHFGTHCPPVRVRMLGGAAVVTAVLDEIPGLSPGDRLLEVDGEEVGARCRRLAPCLAHSTPQALAARLGETLLCGPPGKAVRLVAQGTEPAPRTLLLPRTLPWREAKQAAIALRPGEPWARLPAGVGYLDLTRLDRASFPKAFEAVQDCAALVLDLRGYPKGTAWLLAPRLGPRSRDAAVFSKAFQFLPHVEVGRPTYTFTQPTPPPLLPPFPGPVAVLIDEETMSQGEHTCMYIRAVRQAVFVGSTTNGTNGDITNISLPGGILVTFTGHGVTWPDGRGIQRRGIEPDIQAVPTPEGLRAGRDEVLERALDCLKRPK